MKPDASNPWRKVSDAIIERPDGARIVRVPVGPERDRYVAWPAEKRAPALGCYGTADEAREALAEPRQGALL